MGGKTSGLGRAGASVGGMGGKGMRKPQAPQGGLSLGGPMGGMGRPPMSAPQSNMGGGQMAAGPELGNQIRDFMERRNANQGGY